ncbi:gliding motility-associated C-terminal domain-containing protein [Flavihumibacter petaseus]|nr:gliding motility-associated C-terminal domain-containing protein [Flavihumibacter petaseus]
MTTIILAACLLTGCQLYAQNISNRGKEFWAGFGHHGNMEWPQNSLFPDEWPAMKLFFSAEEKAHVVVTVEGTAYRKEYDVPANSVITSDFIPSGTGGPNPDPQFIDARLWTRTSAFGGNNSEGLFQNKGIHIVSDVPIVAYAFEYAAFTQAASMLLPVESWGYGYRVLTAKQDANGSDVYNYSWVFVVAAENDTRLQVTPSVKTRNGRLANVPFEVTLQKGEIYQLLGGGTNNSSMGEMSGTSIRSLPNSSGKCLPFATFTGSSGTYVACDDYGVSPFPPEECLYQQLFPVQAWGRAYLTTPSQVDTDPKKHNNNIFRVMVSDPSGVVKRNGVPLTGMTTRNFYEFTSKTADYIESNVPIQVLQIFPSMGYCDTEGSGDPEMIVLSPVEQGIKRVGLYRNEKTVIDWNFVALTIPTEGLNSLTIDGGKTFDYSYPHPYKTGYSVVIKRWRTLAAPKAPAQAIIQSDSAFTLITYGLGSAENYGYNGGAYLKNLNGFPELHNQYNTSDTANSFTCAKTPVKLSVLLRYKPSKLDWRLSQMADNISPAVDVIMNNPAEDGIEYRNGLPYYRYSLTGYYTFKHAGLDTVPVFASSVVVENCSQEEPIFYEIDVHDAKIADFDIEMIPCKPTEPVKFIGDEKFTDQTDVKRWIWTFDNGGAISNAEGKDQSLIFKSGNNSAKMIGVDEHGCIVDTTKTFMVADAFGKPDFSVVGSACEGSTVTFRATVPQPDALSWYWDFGDGTTRTITDNGDEQINTYKKAGTYEVRHAVKYNAGCASDTTTKTIVVYANPLLTVDYPLGCLPSDGRINFNGGVTVPDSQPVEARSYAWNFGDVNATPANPNTANTLNASHRYTTAGSYTIQFKAATVNGCTAALEVEASLNLKPVISFPALTAVCESATGVTVAKATVTNGVGGTGVYKGTGVDANGILHPDIAKAGTHTVWYLFTTTEGCQDSASQTITILPQPGADFTATPDVCLDQATNISFTVAGGPMVTRWEWDFGNNITDTRLNGSPFTVTYVKTGTYTITLTTTGNNGCSSAPVTKVVNVNANPTAAFTAPSAICLPSGVAAFTNTSTIADGSVLNYTWNFGDNNQSTVASPNHTYAGPGNYTVVLKATSAKGCSATASQVLNKFLTQPVAGFDMNSTEVCQGAVISFTDKSTASGSGVDKWTWNFGDGTTSVERNPEKTFSQAGQFTISLMVTSKDGCPSAPVQKTVTAYLQPVINAGPDFAVPEGSVIRFQATANSTNLQFRWSPSAGLSDQAALQPTLTVQNDGQYMLTATGEHNCQATDMLNVLVQRPVGVPNVFSPNGDGVNDTWQIKNIQLYPSAIIEVFNRYGKVVFSSHGYSRPWDGKMNGAPLPVGTYYYLIRLGNGDAPLKGSVTILR